jgi:glycosyltransferase involved in cell wall biosynthesis
MSEIVKKDLLSLKPDAKILKLEHPNYQLFGEKISKIEALQKLQKENIALDSSKRTILFFGLIRDYKGLDLLIDAFAMLDDSYQLLIVGECYGPFEKYQTQINNAKNRSTIFVVNKFIPDDEVGTYFSVADVCVLPYKSATQSGIIAVANQFLVPVIATNVGGLSESIQDKKTGIIIQELDAKKIKEGICHFFEENLKEQFQQNIAERNKQQSWDFFAEKTLEFAKNLQNS